MMCIKYAVIAEQRCQFQLKSFSDISTKIEQVSHNTVLHTLRHNTKEINIMICMIRISNGMIAVHRRFFLSRNRGPLEIIIGNNCYSDA